MGRGGLSQRDLRAILEFLRALYAFQDHDGFVSTTVHGLPRVIASDLTAYCEIDPVARTSENWLDRPEVNTPDAGRIWEAYMLEMPVLAHYVRTGDGSALRITDFMAQRRFRDTGVYAEHYRPKDLEYVLATWVPSPQLAIGIGVGRDSRDYTDDERTALELLRPHLIQGWRNAQAVTKMRREAQVGRALASLRQDVVVLRRDGALLSAGERAQRSLRAFFPGTAAAVPEDVTAWAVEVMADLGEGPDDLPREISPLVRSAAGARLIVRPFVTESGLVLTVEEQRERGAPAERLTSREREVLACVAAGKTNEEIADLLGCAPKTVEKHLEHVYAKLDVPNRAAAVAALAAPG